MSSETDLQARGQNSAGVAPVCQTRAPTVVEKRETAAEAGIGVTIHVVERDEGTRPSIPANEKPLHTEIEARRARFPGELTVIDALKPSAEVDRRDEGEDAGEIVAVEIVRRCLRAPPAAVILAADQ